jgi:DNA-binding transcriptional ArsR family regulator
MEKFKQVIEESFGDGSWFTSKDILGAYRRTYNEDLKLSTVSTYLLRLYNSGLLERRGERKNRMYRLVKKVEVSRV